MKISTESLEITIDPLSTSIESTKISMKFPNLQEFIDKEEEKMLYFALIRKITIVWQAFHSVKEKNSQPKSWMNCIRQMINYSFRYIFPSSID